MNNLRTCETFQGFFVVSNHYAHHSKKKKKVPSGNFFYNTQLSLVYIAWFQHEIAKRWKKISVLPIKIILYVAIDDLCNKLVGKKVANIMKYW